MILKQELVLDASVHLTQGLHQTLAKAMFLTFHIIHFQAKSQYSMINGIVMQKI